MTSGKVSKAKRKDEKTELREDLIAQLEAADTAQAEKLAKSKDHLVAQLKMVSDKYLTVNGYMQARQAYKEAAGASDGQGHIAHTAARELAEKISTLAGELAVKLAGIDVMELDDGFLDGLLDADFVKKQSSVRDIAEQLLVVNLLQNIGPSIEDIASFREGSAAGIAKLKEELDALDSEKNGLTLVK